MSRKLTIPLFSVLFLIVASCSRDEPFYPKPQPEPEPFIEYACPKADDIYKIYPDTFFVNPTGLYIIYEKKPIKLTYTDEFSTTFALFTCEGKFDNRNKTVNSPLSWKIKTDDQKIRDLVYANQGVIQIKQVLLPKDIDRILTFKEGERMEYCVSLLNFKEDVIQTSKITFIYKKDLQP
ncbi:hypothetical protein [Sphingobacterium sp. UBA7038]|uniref:hypothetical protein n=1 Tax=Sphingobacterium TaxID=28453 RepID=UPI000E859C87|nr:hypothetical protein [Sphingobacterium sp. UBA7038]HBI87245.1 hypothetical protein [Sphingobacterium sp.]